MSTAVAVVTLDSPELAAVEATKAEAIRRVFEPMVDTLKGFEEGFVAIMQAKADGITPELSQRARRLRLDIAKVRVEAEKHRKAMKEEYLLAGRAIDGTNNILKWAISQKEEALEEIEKHVERMEAERIEALQAERAEALAAYVAFAHERDLGTMDADVWAAYLATKRVEHEDRMEAERVAAAERAEAERLRQVDAERTRDAAPFYDFLPVDARDSLWAMEADEYADALSAAKEAKATHEAEQEKIRAEHERLKKEAAKKEKARLEAEAKAAKKEKARLEAEAKAAKAPVQKRLTEWVESFDLPALPGDDHPKAEEIRARFGSFHEWAKKKIAEL